MASSLIDRWIEKRDDAVRVLDLAGVSEARERTRAAGRAVGLIGERLEMLVAAVSELATNQLLHAHGGLIAVRAIHRGDMPGLEVVAADRGKGLRQPVSALAGSGDRTKGGLGVGVSAVRRLSDEVDIDVRLEEGTCFWARKFAAPVPRGREVGIWGVPKLGDVVSGDDATFVRSEERLTIAVADGLGHGPAAREASHLIMAGLGGAPDRDWVALLHGLDEMARETRGAALSIIRIDDRASAAECVAVGNVAAFFQIGTTTRHFGGASWTVGGKNRTARTVRPDAQPTTTNAAFVLCSDGVSRSAALDAAWLREHPLLIAHAVADAFGRSTDDVTVLVAR